MAGGLRNGQIVVWDVASGTKLREWTAHQVLTNPAIPRMGVRVLRYQSDGKTLISTGVDDVVRWWNSDNGLVLRELPVKNADTWERGLAIDDTCRWAAVTRTNGVELMALLADVGIGGVIGVPGRVGECRLHADQLMPVVEVVFSDLDQRVAALRAVERFDGEEVEDAGVGVCAQSVGEQRMDLRFTGLVATGERVRDGAVGLPSCRRVRGRLLIVHEPSARLARPASRALT
jgi:hypothetical protein